MENTKDEVIVQTKDLNGNIIKSDTINPKVIVTESTSKEIPVKTKVLNSKVETYLDGKKVSVWNKK